MKSGPWRGAVESKLSDKDFLVMFSGGTPKAAILDYSKFVALWRKVRYLEEQLLQIEATERVLKARASGKPLISMRELVEKAGFTEEDLKSIPDVELTPE